MGAQLQVAGNGALRWDGAAPARRGGDAWVEVLHDAQALQRIEPEWQALAAQALEANPLYEPWMLLPALQARRDAGFCCALVWRRDWRRPGGRILEGLFPLEREARLRSLPAAGFRSWRHRSWLLGTPLVRRQGARGCLATLLDWVRASGASLLELQYVPADGAFHSALAEVLAERDAPMLATDSFTRAFLRKGADAESHLALALSRDTRKNLRRKERRLQERGALQHVALRPGDDIGWWIDAFLRLEASGWKGRRGSALACSEEERRFASEMLRNAFRCGRLQMVGLAFEGRPIALCCNLVAGEGSYAWRCAYDEGFAEYSVGIMAELDTLRALYELADVRWMDSITDPDNATLNRLWTHRRTIHSLLVGLGAWGELCAALLPLLRGAKRVWKAA